MDIRSQIDRLQNHIGEWSTELKEMSMHAGNRADSSRDGIISEVQHGIEELQNKADEIRDRIESLSR